MKFYVVTGNPANQTAARMRTAWRWCRGTATPGTMCTVMDRIRTTTKLLFAHTTMVIMMSLNASPLLTTYTDWVQAKLPNPFKHVFTKLNCCFLFNLSWHDQKL